MKVGDEITTTGTYSGKYIVGIIMGFSVRKRKKGKNWVNVEMLSNEGKTYFIDSVWIENPKKFIEEMENIKEE